MSAFQVEKNHIAYLIDAGLHYGLVTREDAVALANALITENIASLEYRYQGRTDDMIAYRSFAEADLASFDIDKHQVRKSAGCYAYQACEHPTYEGSQAGEFICRLSEHVTSLGADGSRGAVWGAPQPRSRFAEIADDICAPVFGCLVESEFKVWRDAVADRLEREFGTAK